MTCDFCKAQPVTTVPYQLCSFHAAQFYQGLMAFHAGGPLPRTQTPHKNSRNHMTPEQVYAIRRRFYEFGETYAALAKDFNCALATVWSIVTNRSHVMTQHPANVFLRKRA